MPIATLTPIADAYISEAAPDTNYGTANQMFAGQDGSPPTGNVTLLRFDLSGIPDDAVISGVSLALYWDGGGQNPGDQWVVWKCLRDWTEDAATWNHYDGANDWGTAGCGNSTTDYASTYLGYHVSAGSEVPGYHSANLTIASKADLANLRISGQSNAWFAFVSRHVTGNTQPTLTVTYTVPPGPKGKWRLGACPGCRTCNRPVVHPVRCTCPEDFVDTGVSAACCYEVVVSGLTGDLTRLNRVWHLAKQAAESPTGHCTYKVRFCRPDTLVSEDLTFEILNSNGVYTATVVMGTIGAWSQVLPAKPHVEDTFDALVLISGSGVCDSITPDFDLSWCASFAASECDFCACGVMPEWLLVEVDGVTNDLCSHCSDIDGAYLVLNDAFSAGFSNTAACIWHYGVYETNPGTVLLSDGVEHYDYLDPPYQRYQCVNTESRVSIAVGVIGSYDDPDEPPVRYELWVRIMVTPTVWPPPGHPTYDPMHEGWYVEFWHDFGATVPQCGVFDLGPSDFTVRSSSGAGRMGCSFQSATIRVRAL